MDGLPPRLFRFAEFELDVTSCQLRRAGQVVRLERRPMDLLVCLVERRGVLVTRQELIDLLWGPNVFIDFETGLNTAIRKVRQALGDSPDRPRFVETIVGRGYRFMWTVDAIGARPAARLLVLPFTWIDSEADGEYLADGLTEETIASLGQIDTDQLRVIGRTTAMTYRQSRKSIAEIGRELDVAFIVEGSIQRLDEHLRVIAKLVRVADQTQVWSQVFERTPSGLRGLQQELSVSIVRHTSDHVSLSRIEHVAERHPVPADAYDLYLRGRRFWHQLTPTTTRVAIECFTRATAVDAGYALAWAAIAEAHASAPINGDAPPDQSRAKARRAADRAAEADRDLAEVQHVIGQILWMLEWRWPAAEDAFRRALARDASFAWSHTMLAHVLSQSGRHIEARREMDAALALEPLAPLHFAMSSQIALQSRDPALAMAHAERAIALDTEFWVGHMMCSQAAVEMTDLDRALATSAHAVRLSGGNSKPLSLRAYVLARSGRIDEARAIEDALKASAQSRYVPPYALALVAAGLNNATEMFEWLERAVEARDVHLVFLTVDPKWDTYRTDGRFQRVLDRCAFESRGDPAIALRNE